MCDFVYDTKHGYMVSGILLKIWVYDTKMYDTKCKTFNWNTLVKHELIFLVWWINLVKKPKPKFCSRGTQNEKEKPIKTTLFQLSQSDLILKHTKVVTDAPPANSGMQITIPSEPKGVNEILPIWIY